jgi:hypothetical protein
MAIGDTVQAGLMRVDFSPIQRAGEAQARANQAFGQALGGIVDKFYQKKKDKQEREEREQAYRQMGLSDEEAKAASRDKDLANQFINKMNADRNYGLQLDQFKQAEYLRNLQGEQILQNMARLKTADELAEENRMSENQFMQSLMSQTASPQAQRQADIAMPGLPALGNGDARNRFMQAQLEDPQNQVPVSSLGSQDFGRFASREGLDPKLSVSRIEALRQAELASQPKPLSPSEQLAREEFEYKKSQDLNKPNLTDGEKSRDKKFGEELVEFNLPDINKGLEQLTEASEALSKSNTLTGPIVSLMPNFVGDRVNPKAAEVREAVEEVVQRNLRLVLGAQFTEKEGERLISRAYNPTLDEAENKKRVERLIKSIKDAAQEKLNMKSYFEKNGTLKGYDSESPTIESIEQSAFGESAPAPQSLLDEIERKKQLRSKRAGL